MLSAMSPAELNALGDSPGGRLQLTPIGGKHFVKCVGSCEDHFGREARIPLRQFWRQHIFQIMRELAQLTVPAGGGVPL